MVTGVPITDCQRADIAAYIDGELLPAEELALELHLAGCGACSSVLNEQKVFLNDLEHSLKGRELELPETFAKVVVANAESQVTGVRRSGELFNAIFICAALLIFVLFALGPAGRDLIEKMFAVAGFFGHLIYSFLLGVTIVLRNVASQFPADRVLTTAVVLISFGVLMLASRKWMRLRRI